MGIFDILVFGVHLWIFLYMFAGFLFVVAIILYIKREILFKIYYTARFPEATLKVFIHYPGNLYKIYYRLVPDKDTFEINKKLYYYNDKKLQKENEFYLMNTDKGWQIKIEGKIYDAPKFIERLIKRKGSKYPEIHYLYNCPNPLDFSVKDKMIKLSSMDLNELKNNDLFQKLLSLESEKVTFIILIVLAIANLLITMYLLAKISGWLK
jgi:hypothetical protein